MCYIFGVSCRFWLVVWMVMMWNPPAGAEICTFCEGPSVEERTTLAAVVFIGEVRGTMPVAYDDPRWNTAPPEGWRRSPTTEAVEFLVLSVEKGEPEIRNGRIVLGLIETGYGGGLGYPRGTILRVFAFPGRSGGLNFCTGSCRLAPEPISADEVPARAGCATCGISEAPLSPAGQALIALLLLRVSRRRSDLRRR